MTEAQSTTAIELHSIRHVYSKIVAVDDVSLTVPSGSTVALIGPDGVGKSTLMALIAGVKRIQNGKLTALGADMRDPRQRQHVMPRIAYMPQGLGKNLYTALTVSENVDFFGRLFGQDRAERESRITKLLGAIGLAQFANRFMGKLSGGMKQKLGLCCALVHDPDLLLLDEPTTGVDPLSRRQFWELVDGIMAARPGLTVVVATADMDEADRFGRVVMMDGGKILADGAPHELKKNTNTDTLERAFIALLPAERTAELRQIMPAVASVPPDGPIAIEAHDLTRRFGTFIAVDKASFSIRQGEIFGFLGSNGCGKSTTMKMLTGLLPPSSGEALLFGQKLEAADIETRRRIGYMSQAFSLYSELTVRQNLHLHAEIFDIRGPRGAKRLETVIRQFGLAPHLDDLPDALPLGVRQRLSLAVAVLHEPQILILDEPTSGVDPVARDMFWKQLISLSREQHVTIFVTTHFMSEALRCDRISFMHAGRVIACDTPQKLQEDQNANTLEDAFIAYMQKGGAQENLPSASSAFQTTEGTTSRHYPAFSVQRILAYGWREAVELARDPIRLTIALAGTLILMLVFGFGITLDVDRVKFAVLDFDQTPESRLYVDQYAGSSYFLQRPPLHSQPELDHALRSHAITFAVEIPPNFSRSLHQMHPVDVSATVDGSNVFFALTIISYITSLNDRFLQDLARHGTEGQTSSVDVATRFRYNQAFRSVDAMVPSTIALLLVFVPSILTALSVVREKELGTITNLYGTPVSKIEFLLGKQIPYVILALVNFLVMVIMAVTIFAVPLKGSLLGLTLGALVYVFATTAIGLLSSCVTKTQMAAVFGTAIATMLPATQFSGMLQPVSTLKGTGYIIGTIFPTTYFMKVSVGAFTKALTFVDVLPFIFWMLLIWPALLLLAMFLLPKQEA
jgi:ribosome-dependent ATPase